MSPKLLALVLALLQLSAPLSPGTGQAPAALVQAFWPVAPAPPVHEGPDGVRAVARAAATGFTLWDGQRWQPAFLRGVNLGSTVPGALPGQVQTAATRDDYLRWFRLAGDLGADVLRIYTLFPPHFYRALAEYNARAPRPLYLVQGIWPPEDELEHGDAWAPAAVAAYTAEIDRNVDALHGRTAIPERRGRSWGTYDADVSPYLLGWLLGAEWEPHWVEPTDRAHPGMAPYAGKYVAAAPGATPFESWLASMLDHLATRERDLYRWERPLAFVNWPTADALAHPYEPFPFEDRVTVDPNRVRPTAAFGAGVYAAYHVYPFYPDFLHYTPEYQTYRNFRGEPDPYAAYLHALKQHHRDMPVVVAEFGVPSSRGVARFAALGRDQGWHSEDAQARVNAGMLQVIRSEGYAGAFVFALTDEWFKPAWNTMDFESDPERRALAHNRLTNEQHYGLVAVEPPTPLALDGDAADWHAARFPAQYEAAGPPAGAPRVRVLRAQADAANLHLLLELDGMPRRPDGSPDWDQAQLLITVRTQPGGNRDLPLGIPHRLAEGAQAALHLGGPGNARVLVPEHWDPFLSLYGHQLKLVPFPERARQDDTGMWNPWRLPNNKAMTVPVSGQEVAFRSFEAGQLVWGTTTPGPDQTSLADWYATPDTVELRIPWLLLGISYPARRQALADLYAGPDIRHVDFDQVRIGAVLFAPGGAPRILDVVAPVPFSWDLWGRPAWVERTKPAYHAIRQVFREFGARDGRE